MASRNTRRKQHKKQHNRVEVFRGLSAEQRREESAKWLAEKQALARKRAQSLIEPEAWKLAPNPQVVAEAYALDPSGELLADLKRGITEAVGAAAEMWVHGSSTRSNEKRRENICA